MMTYVYNADIYCEGCGSAVRADIDAENRAPADPTDESSYDSGDYPKGPYPDGGGEADSPQHCADCGAFLENPLTGDGYAYACELVEAYARNGRGSPDVLRQWIDHYDLRAWSGSWNRPGFLPETDAAVFVSGPDGREAERVAREYVADSMLEHAEEDRDNAAVSGSPEREEAAGPRLEDVRRAAERIRSGESDCEIVLVAGGGGMAYEVAELSAGDVLG